MEYYFFVIIVIIVLKILFWTCYFYVRAQRIRQAQPPQRFLIIGTQTVTRARNNPYNDRSAIINHAEPVSATAPPPYAEVVKDGSCPLPPSYAQATAAPGASGFTHTPVSSAPTPQGSGYAGASAMPAYNPADAAGSPSATGYTPAASQMMNSYPPSHSQMVGGQPPTSVNSHTTVTMGQNFPAPPQ